MKKVYFDYAATTPVDPKVAAAMKPFLTDKFGNPASIHDFGQQADSALERSRRIIANTIGANSNEIIFTSSATESNNLAIKGIAWAKGKGHILVSSVEHDCVLESSNWLKTLGFEVDLIPVDKFGLVDPQTVVKMIKENTILVSVMQANNELGTIEPIAEIGKVCKDKGIIFHVDAAQTLGKEMIDVNKMNIDLLTGSSHKIYGPKGVGLLYVKKGVRLVPLLHGGGQELGLRSSTVNVAGIVAFAKALQIVDNEREKESKRLTKLRDRIIRRVLEIIPNSYLNGHPKKRLANNINLRFDFIEGESLLLRLSGKGVAVSTGSACSSPKLAPSHVLLAIGLKPEQAHGSIRISLGRWTREQDVDYLLSILPRTVKDLRRISPFKANE